MMTFIGHRTGSSGLALAAAALVVLTPPLIFGQKQPEATSGPSVAGNYLAASPPADYTGAERCRSCHKPEFTEFEKTPHAKIAIPDKGYISGCEACHGPGKAHADAMEDAEGDDAKIAAGLKKFPIFAFRDNSEQNASRCLSCHISSKQQDAFAHSEHAAHDVSCGDCHTSHLVTEVKDLSKGDLSSARLLLPRAAPAGRGPLAAQQPAEAGGAGALFRLPWHHSGPVRPAGSPPRAGRADKVHRLPQPPRHYEPG